MARPTVISSDETKVKADHPPKVAPINILRSPSRNYAGIQREILGAITQHLAPDEFSATGNEIVPGSLNFGLFIRPKFDPADVVMSHGLADKKYFLRRNRFTGERICNQLAHVLLPGEWLKRRLLAVDDLEIGAERLHVVGWPRLDALLATQRELAAVPRMPGSKPKVLWAPTHDYARRGEERVSMSSFPELQEFIPFFERHFDLAVSLHPRNRADKEPTHQALLDCDFVISDYGTLVYEAWALGKPVIFPHWLIGDRIRRYLRRSAEAHIFNERLGLHADSPQQIVDFVMDGAGMDERTSAFMADYLEPTYAGRSGQRVATLLRDLSAAPR